jgi:chromosome segregation ATPase
MAEEKTQGSRVTAFLTQIIAISGLVVSLLGNVIQYQMLKTKQEELRQAQLKLDATLEDSRKQRESFDNYMRDLEERLASIDTKIEEAKLEELRGKRGLNYAPLDQKEIAVQIIQTARETQQKLLLERDKLQDKLDAARAMAGGRQ